MKNRNTTFFAPHLAVRNVRAAMEFYRKAFDAIVIRIWNNPDDSVHVAEMKIQGLLFHLHEEVARSKQLSPETVRATTVLIGLFVPDPDMLLKQAADTGG